MKKKNLLSAAIGAGIMAATAVWVIMTRKERASGEKPPRRAPQLDIRNPGEQSEFSTSPEEVEFER